MLILRFDREIRELVRRHCGCERFWEITPTGFLNHGVFPPQLLTDAQAWSLAPPPATFNPRLKANDADHIYTLCWSYLPNTMAEIWVREVARQSGQPVDWHPFGGRNILWAADDLEAVAATIKLLEPLLVKMQRCCFDYYGPETDPNKAIGLWPPGGYFPNPNRPIYWPAAAA